MDQALLGYRSRERDRGNVNVWLGGSFPLPGLLLKVPPTGCLKQKCIVQEFQRLKVWNHEVCPAVTTDRAFTLGLRMAVVSLVSPHLHSSVCVSMDISLSKRWELVKDREAWRAAVHGAAKCQALLSDWTTSMSLPVSSFHSPAFRHIYFQI